MRSFQIGLVMPTITLASAVLAQSQIYEFPTVSGPGGSTGCTVNVGLTCSNLSGTSYAYVYVNGYYSGADGGGGYFVRNGTSCSANGGTILTDSIGDCFYRASTNWNVREWGAYCDVVVADQPISYNYSGTPSNVVATTQPLTSNDAQKLIVIPGLGGPPYSDMGDPSGSTLVNKGSAYTPGDQVTFAVAGATSNILIVVDSISGGGMTGPISTWHFLNYGSITTVGGALPSSITGTGGTGTSAVLDPVWTGSTYAGLISGVSSGGGTATITLSSNVTIPSGRTVNPGWYYGRDDHSAITGAINSLSAEIATPPGATQINLPGNCGVTQQIIAPTASTNNPPLVGLGTTSTGLYALASITGSVFARTSTGSGGMGGGLSKMTIEAGGLTSGPALEVDGGRTQTFSNLYVRDGVGSGNAVVRCGLGGGNGGGNWFENIRAETDSGLFSGAQFPDADFDMEHDCHDSFFAKLIGVNATLANLMHVKGGGLHFENVHMFNTLFPDVPGSADYGIALPKMITSSARR